MTAALLVALAIGACGPAGSGGAASGPAGTATAGEIELAANVRLDLQGRCEPLRDGLPENALAAIRCHPEDVAIADVRLYLFNRPAETMAAYFAAIDAVGLEPRTDGHGLPFGEDSYIPEPEGPLSEYRMGWWVDDDGHGQLVVASPPYVVFHVTGSDANVDALHPWAWRGNQDVPGGPTVWRETGPADPNAKR
ncbi:MAG TPA: hypothetical protein VFX65_03170 [Candidatus Limnocylindrales bacterium]|nr:hypothetical protein [Candidatus Limnocylindrales bacterium]